MSEKQHSPNPLVSQLLRHNEMLQEQINKRDEKIVFLENKINDLLSNRHDNKQDKNETPTVIEFSKPTQASKENW